MVLILGQLEGVPIHRGLGLLHAAHDVLNSDPELLYS